ncbi:MAG: DNA lyase [Bifidobacterium sp.]|jgi:endonuclease-3 related protein|nr:DNA lyase [Bifidobacterium sp.]MCH4174723.1 DNA lyase [Bifidobacterium sp.]
MIHSSTDARGQQREVSQSHVTDELFSIRDVFSLMLKTMGPSHWWPAQTRFEVMVGAILTQNTAWGNVASSLEQLRAAEALNPQTLIHTDNNRLQELIRPSGFQKNKSRALQSLCQWYQDQCAFEPQRVREMADTDLRAQLLNIFGIGGETADDMLLYVFDRKVFIADTYARRLCTFLGFDVPKGYEAFRSWMMPQIASESFTLSELQEFHGLIDEFGKAHRSAESMKGSFLADIAALRA